MTPKEKAEELVERFENAAYNYFTNTGDGVEIVMLAKQCALIAVEEIINSVVITDLTTAENQFIYWQQVKQEIEKL